MTPFTSEVDFNLFPTGHRLGREFRMGGFSFTHEGEDGELEIVEHDGLRGLQIPEAGLLIAAPGPVQVFGFTVGTFAKGLRLLYMSAEQRLLGDRQFYFQDRHEDVKAKLTKPVAFFRFLEGGNHGSLVKFSVTAHLSQTEPVIDSDIWEHKD